MVCGEVVEVNSHIFYTHTESNDVFLCIAAPAVL